MNAIIGYCDPFCAAPGEPVRFMVSCDGVASYRTEIVRLICADDSPGGPGYKEECIATALDDSYPGVYQAIHPGSWMYVAPCADLDALTSFSVQAFIWPSTPEKGRQGVITRWSDSGSTGFGLFVDAAGCAAFTLGDAAGNTATLSTGARFLPRQWYLVAASYDADTHVARVVQRPLKSFPGIADSGEASETVTLGAVHAPGVPLAIAAFGGDPIPGEPPTAVAHFNGKIDRPRFARRTLSPNEMTALTESDIPSYLESAVVAAWDFARDMSSTKAHDLSRNELHGTLNNFPTRAVTGHNWTGEAMSWRDAPDHYGAIHFHDDDICDAGWQVSFTLDVPEKARSGIYAARLASGGVEEYIPFCVRPPRGTTSANIAFLVPTATYMAYANYVSWADLPVAEKLFSALWVAEDADLFINEHREFGASTYDSHLDGSGICHGSRLRPMLNLRPKRRQLWNLNADTHITDWLEALGFPYDVITDEDLHREGLDILSPYRAVVTGTHPEYYSREMLDALEGYTASGGRLVYTGGNGFYWRIAFHPETTGIVEVRRCNGTRNWIARPGEHYHAFDGQFGGTWRELGRTPNRLVGVGFASEGFDYSTHYVRQPDSFEPRAAFIFEGIGKNEHIGNFGSVGGGASGIEIDRADQALGTPPHALVLASSDGHSNNYLVVLEDIPLNYPGTGGAESPLVRADLVFFETAEGGAVFSTGSIAWAASLAHNDYNNNVSRITENVLRRFLDDTPF